MVVAVAQFDATLRVRTNMLAKRHGEKRYPAWILFYHGCVEISHDLCNLIFFSQYMFFITFQSGGGAGPARVA